MNLNRLKGLKIKHMINLIACFNFGTAFTFNNLSAEQAEIASKSGLLLASAKLSILPGQLLHSAQLSKNSQGRMLNFAGVAGCDVTINFETSRPIGLVYGQQCMIGWSGDRKIP